MRPSLMVDGFRRPQERRHQREGSRVAKASRSDASIRALASNGAPLTPKRPALDVKPAVDLGGWRNDVLGMLAEATGRRRIHGGYTDPRDRGR